MQIRSLVEQRFSEPTPCNGHCQKQARLKFLSSSDENLLVCFACPSGYISRIVTYGEDINVQTFKEFISKLMSSVQKVEDEDIRVATRHAWDLGLQDDKESILRVAYWTQNYRRTKSDDPNRISLFLCASCNSPFLQPLSSKNSLCEKCRRTTTT